MKKSRPKPATSRSSREPVFYTPTITARQPDGSVTVRAGKPVILKGEDEITSAEAARILGCQVNWVGALCDRGTFLEGRDFRRIGERGNYRLRRASVIKHAGLGLEAAE